MPLLASRNPTLAYLMHFVVLAALYGGIAWLSLVFIPQGTNGASLVWPIAGIGLAGLLLWGLNLWPALALALLTVLIARGIDPSLAAGAALGNTLEALLGAYILKRAGFHPLMSRLRDTLGLILAAFGATFFSSLVIGAARALYFNQPLDVQLITGLWIGHTVSLLSFGPFLIRWGYRPFFTKTWREIAEGFVLFGAIFVITFFIFWTPHGSFGGVSLIYALILLFIWASLRTGPRGVSLSILIAALVSISGVLWGYGPVTANSVQALFGIQLLVGTLSLIFLLFTSTTEERKEAILALEGHVGQLEDALQKISSEDKAKSEFIAILAHELRNPLSPVLSGIEILKMHNAGPPEVLRMMGAHLNTLARLLDDLLDITRISQKKFKLERQAVSMRDILNQSHQMVEHYISSQKHSFIMTVPEEEIWLNADPVRLEQVFVNLFNNAAKYTPPHGTISVSLAREGAEAVVRVRDNGQGIAPERVHKIFEPFAGGLQRMSQGPGGLHIGLSLAKRMVELHQGTIEMHSAGPGQGSEFMVRLPIPEVAQPPLLQPTKKDSRGRFSKEAVQSHARAAGAISVLVVDDNQAAAELLATLLRHNGHEARVAHTGLGALAAASAARPQAVLLDIGLPDIDGYEVAKRLRAGHGSALTIVALTGYGQDEDRDKTKLAGFDDHLVKPVSIVDIERALANIKKF